MARSERVGVEGGRRRRDSGVVENLAEAELKRELMRLVSSIAADDGGGVATTAAGDGDPIVEILDRASAALASLRDLKISRIGNYDNNNNNNNNNGLGGKRTPPEKKSPPEAAAVEAVPEHFLCPISSELMKDPVILATGQTYERTFIQAWLDGGHRTCPRTQQVLSHSILTPNHLIRQMISEWCESHGLKPPPNSTAGDDDDDSSAGAGGGGGAAVTRGERIQLDCLLEKLSSLPEQKRAARELRQLTKRTPSFRSLLGESPVAIPSLLSLLSSPSSSSTEPELQEDVVTTLLNLSIHDSNKKLMGDNPHAIPLLIDALKTGGTMETRSNAAAALFTLSALDSNKLKIGEFGAMDPLVELLDQGSPAAKKDAASAIFNLCVAHENRSRAVREGAVQVLLKTIREETLIDESLAILAMLAAHQQAVEEIGEAGGVPCLLGIIRESSCGRNRENAAVILYAVCISDRRKLREVREEEEMNGTLSQLAVNGTSRARRKAAGILERLNRTRGVPYFSL